MADPITHHREALAMLRVQIDAALRFDDSLLHEMSPDEIEKRNREHPGAHFVIGDFKITCLHPEKFNL